MTFEPLEIIGVVTDEVGSPRNDGTPGSGLYRVPIRLSRAVSGDEGRYLERLWDHPPSLTTMHRPGTASVYGDLVNLNRTTIDEVRDYHARTLQGVVDKFNADVPVVLAKQRAAADRERAEREAHQRNVADVAGEIEFSSRHDTVPEQ